MIKKLFAVSVAAVTLAASAAGADISNPLIDYDGFAKDAVTVGKLRGDRRVSEAEFIQMSREPNTVVLDARSRPMFQLLHIKGAKNLSLPDITAAELAAIIPDKSTRILIYCNNNFENEQQAFPTKAIRASLNIYTFNTLYAYGYRDVYELGPVIDIRGTRLQLEGEKIAAR